MEKKPVHYDGSGQLKFSQQDSFDQKKFQVTAEMRKNISGNPFEFKTSK